MLLKTSLLARPVRRSLPAEIALFDASTEWHVGTSEPGAATSQPQCRCAKAPCGAAIPRREVLCRIHHGGGGAYAFMHPASTCSPRLRSRRWLRRRR